MERKEQGQSGRVEISGAEHGPWISTFAAVSVASLQPRFDAALCRLGQSEGGDKRLVRCQADEKVSPCRIQRIVEHLAHNTGTLNLSEIEKLARLCHRALTRFPRSVQASTSGAPLQLPHLDSFNALLLQQQ